MVPFDLQLIRLVLHVLAATIWVGGQFVLAGLLPTLRGLGDDATAKVARAFNRLAWPAYVVLLATGIWNLFEINFSQRSTQYQVVLLCKLLAVAATGIGAGLHVISRSKIALAIGGSLAGAGALAALTLGVWLHG